MYQLMDFIIIKIFSFVTPKVDNSVADPVIVFDDLGVPTVYPKFELL